MAAFVPTAEQERALSCPAPLLVLAGAGTGKTTVLTRRLAQVIASGRARPDQVLALTFADKAATEMAGRLAEALAEHGLADRAREVTVATFHSFGGLVIRENLLRLGFDRPPKVLTGGATWQILSSIFDDLTFDAVEITTGGVAGVFNQILHFISQCKDHLVVPEDLESHIRGSDLSGLAPPAVAYLQERLAALADAAGAYRRYEAAKMERGQIDFGDHLLVPVRLFAARPEVREGYRHRFPFVFVDEYQDTNHAQRCLLLHLLDPARPEVMVIGDDDQAIYRWRGAVVHNILRFPREPIFDSARVEVVPMTRNRRSFPPILEVANRAILGVQVRHAKVLDYHEANRAGRALVGGHVAASDAAEGRWIAARILHLEPESRTWASGKRGYGAFAVLCRKRSLFEPVGRALQEAGIPYELIGGTGFYGRWEIRDILSYLRVLADPADDLALARILCSPPVRLSSRDVFHLAEWGRAQEKNSEEERAETDEGEIPERAPRGRQKRQAHLLDAVRRADQIEGLSPAARERLAALWSQLEGFARDRGTLSLSGLVERVVEGTGYRRELMARPGFEARVALLNLAKLEDQARQFEEGAANASLAAFVEFVGFAVESEEQEAEVQPVDEESDAVKVMTVHQAKGLEFPVVFVPGLAAGTFPDTRTGDLDRWYDLPWFLRGDRDDQPGLDLSSVRTDRDLEAARQRRKGEESARRLDDERRLFYVATTRAQRHLYLTRAHWYRTNRKPRDPSLFWTQALESGCVEDLGQEDCPAANPNLALGEAESKTDPLHHDAEEAAGSAAGETLSQLLLEGADPMGWIGGVVGREGGGRWEGLRDEVDRHLERLAAPLRASQPGGVEVSCSALLRYLACPRAYRFVYVDGLPTRPSAAADRGRAVHRRIEEMALEADDHASPLAGQGRIEEADAPVAEVEGREVDEPDLAAEDAEWLAGEAEPEEDELASDSEEDSGDPVEGLLEQYHRSPYGRRPATYVEWPFHLSLPGGTLRGRLDRLDYLSDGQWEVVDFKSGRHDAAAREHYRRQLALYTLAVCQGCGLTPDRVSAHLFFLRDGRDLALPFGEADLQAVRSSAEAALGAIGRGEFPPTADPRVCVHCEYGHLCATRSGEIAGL